MPAATDLRLIRELHHNRLEYVVRLRQLTSHDCINCLEEASLADPVRPMKNHELMVDWKVNDMFKFTQQAAYVETYWTSVYHRFRHPIQLGHLQPSPCR